jgi:hypothetical protein
MTRTVRVFIYATLLSLFLWNGKVAFSEAPPTTDQFLAQHGVENTIPGLRAALKSPDARVRSVMAQLLAQEKDVASVPFIFAAFEKEQYPWHKIPLAYSLAMLHDGRGTAFLLKACTDGLVDNPLAEGNGVRLEAANRLLALGKDKALNLRGDECLVPVIESLENESSDPWNRAASLDYLRDVPHSPPPTLMPKVQSYLLVSLEDPATAVEASDGLARWGDRGAIPALRVAVVAAEKEERARRTIENQRALKFLETNLQSLEARNP